MVESVVVNDGVLVTDGCPAATVVVCDGVVVDRTETPFWSLKVDTVSVMVPATVPWLNCELLPDQVAVVLPAATVKLRVFFGVGPQDALVAPLANCTYWLT